MDDTIILAGRGPSIAGMVLPDHPIMAVSSGVFAIGDRRPEHFCTVDKPRYFCSDRSSIPHAWPHDPICKWWDVCESDTEKHVPSSVATHGGPVVVPSGVQDTLDLDLAVMLQERQGTPGTAPGWLDFPSVVQHTYERFAGPCFASDGVLGLGDSGQVNSVLFAVQVGARLGYKRVLFAGVDLAEKRLRDVSDTLGRWYPLARACGVEWLNLSGESLLSEWMTTK